MAKKKDLHEQANEILKMAEEKGVTQNFFFATTFKRYQTQLKLLEKLEETIDEIGMTVEKEYVKGRMNVCTNPAITEYNKTSTSANGTVSTLINILKSITVDEGASQSKLDTLLSQLDD